MDSSQRCRLCSLQEAVLLPVQVGPARPAGTRRLRFLLEDSVSLPLCWAVRLQGRVTATAASGANPALGPGLQPGAPWTHLSSHLSSQPSGLNRSSLSLQGRSAAPDMRLCVWNRTTGNSCVVLVHGKHVETRLFMSQQESNLEHVTF